MTVWAASQPTRGQLIEKSLFRVAGTVSGAIAGILVVIACGGQPILLAVGLSTWIALCAGIGNLQRGFVAYGTMLAGYSAAMVALLDRAHPDHVLALGLDRMATILVGVLLALAVGLVFTPRAAEEELIGRLRRLTARVLRHVAQGLRGTGDSYLVAERRDILAEMALIEDALEPHGAGSLRSRRSVHAIRTELMTEVELLLAECKSRTTDYRDIVTALEETAATLESGESRTKSLAALDRLVLRSASHPTLRQTLSMMVAAIRDHVGPDFRAREK